MRYHTTKPQGGVLPFRFSFTNLFIGAVVLWLLGFLLSRIHMMHHAYNVLLQKQEDERWLLTQCKNDTFYHNMKQHSKLCDDAAARQHDILILAALRETIDKTYFCGYDPCSDFLDSLLTRVLGRGLITCLVLGGVLLTLPTIFFPLLRQYMNVMADQRVQQLYNMPYGATQYITSHPWTDLQQHPSHNKWE